MTTAPTFAAQQAPTDQGHGVDQRAARQVADRAVPGHWEGDLLLRSQPTAVGTLVERTSRYVMLFALPDGYGADQVRRALAQTIVSLPEQLRRSLTWDQGPEMAEHVRFTVDTGVTVYFCDPSRPWQRGSNENTNRLLRQYLPRAATSGTLPVSAQQDRRRAQHSPS